jgi:8-oxo-dGTP diphosphatase
VRASVYAVNVAGAVVPQAEIAEALWIDPTAPVSIVLAPLTRDHVLPLASSEFP